MNKTIEVILVYIDNAKNAALYINGKKELEGSSIFSGNIINLLSNYIGYKIIYSSYITIDNCDFEKYCNNIFPNDFDDIDERVEIIEQK